MKRVQKQWLEAVPWASVLSINQALCQAQKTEHKPNAAKYAKAQQAWEGAAVRQMTLGEVLDVCKQCYDLAPFVFNNGNTFAAIARTLVEDWLKALPPVEAQIVRTTVAHYVAGLVGRRELREVLDHFEPQLASASPQPQKAAAPAPQAMPPVATSVESTQPSTS